jgi:thiol-disulfide isomerase/thioredoxin
MVLPPLALPDAEGVMHRLSDWAGHPLVVNFWATWCEPCRREIPLLIKLRHERASRGLVIVGIAIDFRAAVVKYAAAAGITYPLLIGEEAGLKSVDAFGMELVFPFSVFADRTGRVVAVKVGELHQDEADFILDRLDDVDRGTLTLATAREQIAAHLRELAVARAKHA